MEDDYIAAVLAAQIMAWNMLMQMPSRLVIPVPEKPKPALRVVAWHGHRIGRDGYQED